MWKVSEFLSRRFSMVADLQEVLEDSECADELKGGEYMEAESDRRRVKRRELVWEVLVGDRRFDFVYILSEESGFLMPKSEVFCFLDIDAPGPQGFSKKLKEAIRLSSPVKSRSSCRIV